jgi:hypothetical protein
MTWNPVHWPWKELDDQIEKLLNKGRVEEKWSCGNRKDLPVGSRVFLYKQGEGSKGIIGTGVTLSNPKDEPHFILDRAKKGLTAKRVNVSWDILNREPIIHLDQLKQRPFPNQNWVFQSSGVEIRDELSNALLSELQIFSKKFHINFPPSVDIEEPSGPERVLQKIFRIIRSTPLAQKVKALHNFKCQICGESLNLGNGVYYAEAHHLWPLGAPHNGPDIEENIICVCPNHHALLDYGAIQLEPKDFERIHEKFIEYHNEKIYQKVII